MGKPIVEERLGGYTFTWEGETQLQILVSRLRLHSSDGRVTGEILIKANDMPIYPPTSLNFTAERSRSGLVNTLGKLDARWQWFDIINQLSLTTIERAREGEPVRELWTSEDIAPPEFLLEPILYKSLPTIIFGEKAVCKSVMSLVIYTCLTLPWLDNPLGWKAPNRPVKTLLLDYEVDYGIAQYNIKSLQRGMGLPPFPLYYRRCSLPLVDDIEQIQQHMSNIGAEALIVDSLGPAVGGDLKDPGQALRFTSALRQLHCGTLLIGQTSKDKESKHRSTFGCYSADTEVLTNHGWKLHQDIEPLDMIACYDTKACCLYWDNYTKKWEYDYAGEVIHIKHKACEALITPNHKVFTTNHGRIIAEALSRAPQKPYKLPYNTPLKHKHCGRRQLRFQLQTGEKWLRLEPFLKFIGYFISEGSIGAGTDYSLIDLTQTVGQTLDNMRECLNQLGFPYKETIRQRQQGRKECHHLLIRYDAGEKGRFNQYRKDKNRKFGRNTLQVHLLARWLEDNCGKGVANKRIPDFIWDLPRSQLKILLDALIEGDGHQYEAGHANYTTISKQLADDVQRLAMLVGLGSQLTSRYRGDNTKLQHELLISKPSRKTITINARDNIEKIDYKGKVYCLTVPTGYYVTRRNGRVAILGNSAFFEYYARNIFFLDKMQEEGEDNFDIALYNTYHNLGRKSKAQGFHLSFNGTGTHINSCPVTARELVAQLGTQERLKQLLLTTGAMTVKDIAQSLELSEDNIRVVLSNLKKKNIVTRVDGGYGMAIKDIKP